jgi:hypothetical protein
MLIQNINITLRLCKVTKKGFMQDVGRTFYAQNLSLCRAKVFDLLSLILPLSTSLFFFRPFYPCLRLNADENWLNSGDKFSGLSSHNIRVAIFINFN